MLPTDRCRGRCAFSHTGNRHVHTPSCTHTHKHTWILTHAHTPAPQRCIKSYINPDTLKHTCTDTSSMHPEVNTHSDVYIKRHQKSFIEHSTIYLTSPHLNYQGHQKQRNQKCLRNLQPKRAEGDVTIKCNVVS